MIKKFLVAIDGSDHGWKALDMAASLAKLSDAELVVMHVVPYEPMSEGLKQFAKAEGIPIEEESARYHAGRTLADTITSKAEIRATKHGLTRVTTQITEGNAANEIVAMAKSEGVDMLFLGSRGLGEITGLLLGSVSHKVVNLAPCTCVIVKMRQQRLQAVFPQVPS
jgi:nucleotide-binding universal stress UspA family protein